MQRLEIIAVGLILGLALWMASIVTAVVLGAFWFGIAAAFGATYNLYLSRMVTRLIRVVQ